MGPTELLKWQWDDRSEPVFPEPFTSRSNAVARLLLEQWINFPRFVLSGKWLRALRQSDGQAR